MWCVCGKDWWLYRQGENFTFLLVENCVNTRYVYRKI